MITDIDKYMDKLELVKEWQKLPGIICTFNETNSGLAQRDYSVKCITRSPEIIVHEGYWIWWCSAHHQPLPWCETGKLQEKVNEIEKTLKLLKDIVSI